MSGFSKFRKAMLDAAQRFLEPALEKHKEELAKVMNNALFNLDGPKQLDRSPYAQELYFGRAFRGFIEISKSLETLDDVGFYIRRFPFEGTEITRDRYLQFHVEAHYSEIYILKERLASYIKLFQRQFKRDPQLPNVEQHCAVLMDAIVKALSGSVSVRGRHVHELRFSDENIDRLSTIGLLLRGSDAAFSDLMRNYYREEYKKVRKIWKNRTRNDVEAIRQLLDVFFDALFPMVFESGTGALRSPHGVRI